MMLPCCSTCFDCSVCVISDFVRSFLFFFQAEDGIRDLVRSRGLGDVYKRQLRTSSYSRSSILATASAAEAAESTQ